MLLGELMRKLKRLNRHLRVYAKDSPYAAGIYVVKNGEFEHICGVDKGDVPEHMQRWTNGLIRKSGWRRVLRILIQNRYVDRFAAQRLFNTHFNYVPLKRTRIEADKLEKWKQEALQRGQEAAIRRYGRPVENYMELDDFLDIARERKRMMGEK